MEKYTATFKNGQQITKTSADGIRNRLDFANWIAINRLGKKYGKLEKIEVQPWIK